MKSRTKINKNRANVPVWVAERDTHLLTSAAAIASARGLFAVETLSGAGAARKVCMRTRGYRVINLA